MANKVVFFCLVLITGCFPIANAQELTATLSAPSVSSPPPPPPQASATVVTAAPPTAAPTQPASVEQMSVTQFQQWLQSNSNSASANPPPPMAAPTTAPIMPSQAAPANTSSYPPVTTRPPVIVRSRRARIPPPLPLTYEEGQQAMLRTLPNNSRRPTNESALAFNAMIEQNMPLTPSQVVQLRQQIDISQRAAAVPPNIPPKPVSSTIMVNLAPGATPPAIRLAQGYVSALVFVDSTGQPWPIASFDIGNPKAVNLQWDGKSNIILIQAVAPYHNGDIVVRLLGLPTPITLMLVTGQRVVDYRADIHVSGIGPNSKDLPMGTGLPPSANVVLLGILDGVAPAGARLLTVRGAEAEAWLLGQKIYLRTRLTVLSPGWMGTMISPDGMHAYELPKTSSVLVSRYGEPAELKIEGF